MSGITWLASYPKSGNTWMRMLLAAYHLGNLDINRVQDLVRQDTDPYAHHAVAPWDIGDAEPGAIAYLRYAALQHILARHSLRPAWVKTHSAIVRLTPDVEAIPVGLTHKAIYLVRDPRDVAVSFAEHMGVELDDAIAKMAHEGSTLDFGAKGLWQTLSSWSYHVRSWHDLSEFPVMVVRYEDMLRNPAKALTKVVEFATEAEADPERVALAVELATFDALARQESAHGFKERSEHTEQFFTRGTAGHWRDHLTPEQAERIEADHGEQMARLHYPLTEAAITA